MRIALSPLSKRLLTILRMNLLLFTINVLLFGLIGYVADVHLDSTVIQGFGYAAIISRYL